MKIIAGCALLMLNTTMVSAATFTVDNTTDVASSACTAAPNDCSLRGAIVAADNMLGSDNVAFNIPMTDPACTPATGICRITITSQINLFTSVVVDGYTQPGALPNTNSTEQGGLNSIIKIELVKSVAGGHSSFITNGNGFTFTLRGVAIAGFDGGGALGVVGGAATATFLIEGNYLGTDASGNAFNPPNTVAVGVSGSGSHRIGGTAPAQRNLISNNLTGISGVTGSTLIQGNLIGTNRAGTQALPNNIGIEGVAGNTMIGGSAIGARNVISGNNQNGINLGGAAVGASVQGNFIGTDVTGLLPLGNGSSGVQLAPDGNTQSVGGLLLGEGNTIAFNGAQGVATRGARGRVNGNQMFGNAQLGIGNPGDSGLVASRRANDVGDSDASTNNGQNFPEISIATFVSNSVNLSYHVDSAAANSAYPLRIEFFKADGDEGRTFLIADNYLLAEAQSIKNLTVPLPTNGPEISDVVIVATATDANGNTSEFSFQPIAMIIETPVPSSCTGNVRIFCEDFESNPQRSIEVSVRATSTLFKPNGNVRLSDNRGAFCDLTLVPTATALTSSGRCVLANSGAPGAIEITAVYDTFSGAFGDVVTGGNVTQSANFVIPPN